MGARNVRTRGLARRVKIATFNANSVRARLAIIVSWLAAHKPDVLCLQETKVTDAEFPVDAIREAGYLAVFRGEKSYNGVALLCRTGPTAVHFGLDDGGPADETRLVRAKVGPIHIVNTYVPQGREIEHAMYRYKLEWFRRLREYFDRHFTPRAKVLWLGDLNVAPEPEDVHNPQDQATHVCFHGDVRRAFDETKAWGFVDCFRKRHPEAGQYTFFDYRATDSLKRNLGWRVDHMLATRPLAARLKDCYIDLEPRRMDKPSDHTFVVAEFAL